MVIILTFLASGGAYLSVRQVLPISAYLVPVVLGAAIAALLWAFLWIDDVSGLSQLMVLSFQTLSGVNSPNEIYQTCGVRHLNLVLKFVYPFLLLAIAIANGAVGVIAMVGLPVGGGMTILGVILGVARRDKSMIVSGLYIFTVAMGAVIVAGLVMRLLHVLSAVGC